MTGLVTYEERLNRDTSWALNQGGYHFENASYVHDTMRRLARRLEALDVGYAVCGAMAMFLHGYRRFTENVNLIVTPDGLVTIHDRLPPDEFEWTEPGGKTVRDVSTGVRVQFLVSGESAATGGDNPITLPKPPVVVVDLAGVQTVKLAVLIELKLAAGTRVLGGRHTADVQEMIRVLRLPARIELELHPSVRSIYQELWELMQHLPPEE